MGLKRWLAGRVTAWLTHEHGDQSDLPLCDFERLSFEIRSGDVLLAYENEALNFDLEHVNPAQTFKIENPTAVVNTSQHLDKAQAFVDFQFTPEGQKVWAEAGFRPVDPAVAAEYADKFPTPEKLWTIDDLGGWKAVDTELFDKENGTITKIYKQATG